MDQNKKLVETIKLSKEGRIFQQMILINLYLILKIFQETL